jgi:cytochrome b involved in lipid metabolism
VPHFRVSETLVRCKCHLTFEKHSRFARNNIYFLPLLLPRWFASQKVTRERHKDSGRMGSSSRHRARQHVPKHDVQETIENLSHSTTTETTTRSKSIAGDSKTGETDGTSTSRTMQKQTVMNAIDAFHQNIRNNTTLQTTTDVETSSRSSSSSEETIRSVGKEMMADDIEAACAPLKRTTERNGERRALAPDARNGQSPPEEEEEEEELEVKKIKETKRRSERCYGCVSCAYYCSLKECEFCASMLVLVSSSTMRDTLKGGGTKRREAKTTGTINDHHHRSSRFTCCDIDRLRKRAREREGEEDEKVWLVAHGNVYEASAFVRFHPAGREVMMKGAGRDNSEDFDMHSKRAREVWRELRVGELIQCPDRGFGGYQPKPGFSVEQCTIM